MNIIQILFYPILCISFRLEEQSNPILQQKPPERSKMVKFIGEPHNVLFHTKHNYVLSVLCISFGMSTWLPVNSVYTQMPLFTQFAPEHWTLPSYFSVLVGAANIAPLIYYFVRNKNLISEAVLITFFLLTSTVALFLLAFTYNSVLSVFGDEHSVFFFILSFFLALVGCTSSVLFLPFMGRLPEVYLVSYFIGEALSGFVPSVIALVQGVGKVSSCKNVTTDGVITETKIYEKSLFSPLVFFLIIGCFMIMSTLSFLYLNYFSNLYSKYSLKSDIQNAKTHESSDNPKQTHDVSINISRKFLVILLTVQAVVNSFSNGILPGVQSYSCLPYGTETYHWSVNLNQITGPLVSYIAYFIPLVSSKLLFVSCIIQIICINYELLTAFMSPFPPLVGTTAGSVTIVSINFLI